MEDPFKSYPTTKKNFSKMVSLFFCQACQRLPKNDVFTVSNCLHFVCDQCKTTDDVCPVKGCFEKGDFMKDITRKMCIHDINQLGENLFGDKFESYRSAGTVEKVKKKIPEPKASTSDKDNLVQVPKSKSSPSMAQNKTLASSSENIPLQRTKDKPFSSPISAVKLENSLLSKLPPNMKTHNLDETIFKMPKQTSNNLDKKNVRGETPLHVATIKGDIQKVSNFLAAGADPNTRDHNGWTPLHEAVQRLNVDLAKLLLENGANPNVLGGEESLSPLHEAVQLSSACLVQLLISKGALADIKCSSGRVPGDYCVDPNVRKALEETSCEVTDTEVFDSTIIGSTLVNRQIVITPSNDLLPHLVDDLQSLIKALRTRGRAEFSQTFSERTSHVVFPNNKLKVASDCVVYYEALMSGKLIVTWDWLEASAEAGDWVDEEPYLVVGTEAYPTNAPEKSRLNELKHLPRLLKGFNIFIRGQMKKPYPSNDQLERILRAGGANVLRREPNPESIPPSEMTVPFHVGVDSSLSKCSHLIVYHEDTKDVFCKYNMVHCKALPAKWLFEVLNNFEILEFDR